MLTECARALLFRGRAQKSERIMKCAWRHAPAVVAVCSTDGEVNQNSFEEEGGVPSADNCVTVYHKPPA